ncbi:LacI family DNA-binding transcriptional regulator [Helcococcus kunzii]|uniref:LacI family DNA-binding transcriptional regulator n=1 Tax=Helcococcus kunzii TaxID=40091 RepID=UPI0024AC8BA5|nr:LacI family DNA-binding transcriptional regulator [Helcococcus kunzii]
MPTMKDVAKHAGVSVGSVSNVINKRQVKQDTYEKVMASIKELNYETNSIAKGLKTNRTYTIGLIIPTVWHPFFSEIAFRIEMTLKKYNYKLLLCNSTDNPETEIEYISMLRRNKIDGIIAITYSDIDKYIESELPFVSIDRYFKQDVNFVSSDNFHGGMLAAKVLVEKGSKKLLYIGSHNQFENATMDRRKGFEHYCKDNNIEYRVIDLLEPEQNYKEALYSLLDSGYDVDGIFSINDFLGLDVIELMSQYGKEVIKDYQIIGFDGIKLSWERDYLISTIVQPVEEIAKQAVQILFKAIEKNSSYVEQVIIPVKFAEGGTTIR